MIDRHLDLQTADGVMSTFVTHPEEGGPFPVVLFYMDAPGKREELHDMARRLGSAGYYVVLPNMYYRSRASYELADRSEAAMAEMFALMNSLTDPLIFRDTEALLAHVDADPAADASRIGCMGYCMSGPFVFSVAAEFADRMRCAASIYGVRLFGDAPDSPHLTADKIKGELYFACAEHDMYAPPAMIEGLAAHLLAAGVNHRIEWYPDTHHGFAFPQRPAYDKPAAERHWERLHALFRRNLG